MLGDKPGRCLTDVEQEPLDLVPREPIEIVVGIVDPEEFRVPFVFPVESDWIRASEFKRFLCVDQIIICIVVVLGEWFFIIIVVEIGGDERGRGEEFRGRRARENIRRMFAHTRSFGKRT